MLGPGFWFLVLHTPPLLPRHIAASYSYVDLDAHALCSGANPIMVCLMDVNMADNQNHSTVNPEPFPPSGMVQFTLYEREDGRMTVFHDLRAKVNFQLFFILESYGTHK